MFIKRVLLFLLPYFFRNHRIFPHLFGSKLGTWVKSRKLSCAFDIVSILVFFCLTCKSAITRTWKVHALFQIRVSLLTSNLRKYPQNYVFIRPVANYLESTVMSIVLEAHNRPGTSETWQLIRNWAHYKWLII